MSLPKYLLLLLGGMVGAFGVGYLAAAIWLDRFLRSS